MKRITFKSIILLVLWDLLILNPLIAQSDNWPQFRGANSSGIAAEHQDPPEIFGPELNMIWNSELSSGQSSPCIWQDNIFITGYEKEDSLLIMYCLDRTLGIIKWQKEIRVKEFEKVHFTSSPANATPATDGERVIFYFSSFGLLCFDFDGELKWEFPMAVPESRHGMGTSPVISGDLVLLNCFGHNNDPSLLALNKYDGKITWKHTSPVQEDESVDSYSTPVVYNDRVIIYRSKDVSAYDIYTGNRIWNYVVNLSPSDAVCTPVIGNDILYVTLFSTLGNRALRKEFPDYTTLSLQYDENRDSLLSKEEVKDFNFRNYPEKGDLVEPLSVFEWFWYWDANKDGFIDNSEWISVIQDCESYYNRQGLKAIRLKGEGDISINNFLWGNSDKVPHVTSPLYFNNLVYTVKSGGIVACFDAETGDLQFRERLGAAGAYFASPIIANNKIYFASINGIVTVIETGNRLNILAKNDLDDKISATPAIVDNKLYIRTSSSLSVFGD